MTREQLEKFASVRAVPRGQENGQSKLTENQVREIRGKYIPRKYHTGMLAEEYGVTPEAIRLIVIRSSWNHV